MEDVCGGYAIRSIKAGANSCATVSHAACFGAAAVRGVDVVALVTNKYLRGMSEAADKLEVLKYDTVKLKLQVKALRCLPPTILGSRTG